MASISIRTSAYILIYSCDNKAYAVGCGAGELLVDLKIEKQKSQGIGSRRGEENIAVGSRRGAKAIQECKPQGISSHRAVEHVGINTRRGFISTGDLLAQKIY